MTDVFAILSTKSGGASQSGARSKLDGAARVEVLGTSFLGVKVRILNSGGPAAFPVGTEVSLPFNDVYASKEELHYFTTLIDFFWGSGLPVGPRPPCSFTHPGEAGEPAKEDDAPTTALGRRTSLSG